MLSVVLAASDEFGSSDLRAWAPVASASIAAVAAFLSFVAVRQAQRQRVEDRRPSLLVQPLRADDGQISFAIANVGRGLARQVRFVCGCHGLYVAGEVDTGLMRPDDEVLIHTSIVAPDDLVQTRSVVTCTDPYGIAYSWDESGRRRRLRSWRRHSTGQASPLEVLKARDPSVAAATVDSHYRMSWHRGGPS